MPARKPHAIHKVHARMRAANIRAEAAIAKAAEIQALVLESIEGGGMFAFENQAASELNWLIAELKQVAIDTLGPVYEPGHTQKRGDAVGAEAPMPHRQPDLLAATRSPRRVARGR